jgi:hypothetical protein
MSVEPPYSELSPSEREWLDAHVVRAREMGLDPGSQDSISEFFDTSLDAVVRGEQPPDIANNVVNIVAVLLGEHLCSSTGLRWAIMNDEQGADLCVFDPATSWTLFPQSSVAKRWESGETEWVEPFCRWVLENVTAPPS